MAADLLDRIRDELAQRAAALAPLMEEHERLVEAVATLTTVESAPAPRRRAARETTPRKRERVERPARGSRASSREARGAIVAALEHGSHTLSELVMVSAMSTAEIRAGLTRLSRQRQVTRVKRAGDGKSAYALAASAQP
ncbi:MAG TPA: hypothetical protein VNV37_07745 [Solirubrobacteraceae bacterium]|jgi:hypothetical protein|nr:hypothetical protein [Solirubrobacteraceae bacterium]